MRGVLLALFPLLLFGCAAIEAKAMKDMNPEQLAAYQKVGVDVYGCVSIAGPPPAGGTTFVFVPKEKKLEASFGSNCQLLTGKTQP